MYHHTGSPSEDREAFMVEGLMEDIFSWFAGTLAGSLWMM